MCSNHEKSIFDPHLQPVSFGKSFVAMSEVKIYTNCNLYRACEGSCLIFAENILFVHVMSCLSYTPLPYRSKYLLPMHVERSRIINLNVSPCSLKPGFHIVVFVVSVVRKKFIGQTEFILSCTTSCICRFFCIEHLYGRFP